jgi:transcription initiation factor TFIID subunit 8
MNPMQEISTTKATSKLHRRAKGKKKRGLNDVQVAETPSEFSFAIAKTAVSQICQSVGYKRSKYDALEALTSVTTKYLEAIARSAASFANASNRTDSNLFDLINSIHDLSSVRGFPGGSKMHTSNLLRSAALKDIVDFVKFSKEVPFSKPIPSKNAYGGQNSEIIIDSSTPTHCIKEAKIQNLHIPRWLPDFPSESLYKKRDRVLVNERKCGEKLWEHSLAMDDCSGNASSVLKSNETNEKEEKDTRMELAKGREKVKFKFGREDEKQIGLGMNMMNGVCKGRKRVSWSHYKINDCMDDENEDERSALKSEIR